MARTPMEKTPVVKEVKTPAPMQPRKKPAQTGTRTKGPGFWSEFGKNLYENFTGREYPNRRTARNNGRNTTRR